MKEKDSQSVKLVNIDADRQGQRIDNFLLGYFKQVPKSVIYRIIRKGEVRVNKKRIKPEYKLQPDDIVRIPPVKVPEKQEPAPINLNKYASLEHAIIYEDERIMVINKPSGLAVHGGSGLKFGLIEGLRALRPQAHFLELVHRLDRETSGVILIAKKRSALRSLHEQLRSNKVDKRYHALVDGQWPAHRHKVKAPLDKNVLRSGERVVRVHDNGKPSETHFRILQSYQNATLVEAKPITGRTHQIRVHCQHAGHAILGDPKYQHDKPMYQQSSPRLFLHAYEIRFIHPGTNERVCYRAEYDKTLQQWLKKIA